MKRQLILLLAAAAALTSCSRARQIKEAGILTDTFLTAYCSGDYDAAAALCTGNLSEHILNTAELISNVDTTVSSAAANILKEIKWDRSVVETEKGTDEVIFTCSTSHNNQTQSYTITLIPSGKGWVISDID